MEVLGVRTDYFGEIGRLKDELNAVILAHYYQEPEIQDLADFVGDSLGLARQAQGTDADVIVFCGVHFMAETAKVLNPEKTVVLPDLEAGCSLADSCPPEDFRRFIEERPGHVVVSYVNTSAEVKALSDVICTSSNAEAVIGSILEGTPIIFGPDKHLGRYLVEKTGREMVLWPGTCMVHVLFSEKKIRQLKLAEAIGASPEEITFTGGATESDNLALLGLLRPGDYLVTAATEHEAILEPAHYLARAGVRVTVLPVDSYGVVSPDALDETIEPETKLVSIMLANNETGTINSVRELVETVHEHGVPFHTDAAQALAKIPLDVEELGVDMMSVSAHKCYGPKGVGALYIRRRHAPGVRRVRPEPLSHGGGQERGLRSGTLNVPGIVGLGRAASLGAAALPEEAEKISGLRDELFVRLRAGAPGVRLNGHPERRLPGTLNVSFPGLDVGDLLGALPEVAASAGSACASLNSGPSHVLKAMGLEDDAHATVRFGLGRFTTSKVVERAAALVVRAVGELEVSVT